MAELPYVQLAAESGHQWKATPSYNLALLERFLHLLQVGQVTDVGANTLGGRTEGANSIGNSEVNLDRC